MNMMCVAGILYKYHYRLFLSAKRSLNDTEQAAYAKMFKEGLKKFGYETRNVSVRKDGAFLEFLGIKDLNTDILMKDLGVSSDIWIKNKVLKTLEIDGSKLLYKP